MRSRSSCFHDPPGRDGGSYRAVLSTSASRRSAFVVVAALVLGVAAAGQAAAEGASRQSLGFTFDADAPGRSTGLQIAIDYVNPAEPNAKPPAVQTVVETLAAGAVIDTSVPARCTASDVELIAMGAAACPADSVVGGGEVDLDTGVAGPLREVHTTVTQLNNTDELILIFQPAQGAGLVRSVAPPISDGGRVVTAQAPPLPGGPPDGFTALRRVRLQLHARITLRDGVEHAYVTTPPTCPASGAWANAVSFTYRDGETQRRTSPTPCRASGPPDEVSSLPLTR